MPDLLLQESIGGSLPDLALDADGNTQTVSGLQRLEQTVKTDLRHPWGGFGLSAVRGSDLPAMIESSFGALATHQVRAAVRDVVRRQPALAWRKTAFQWNSRDEVLDFDARLYTLDGQPAEFNGLEVIDA